MINLFQPRAKSFGAAFVGHRGAAPERAVFADPAASGMFLAAGALGLQEGDEVVLPAPSFLAAADPVRAHGGRPVFCDVDPGTLSSTWEGIEPAVTERTRAVVALQYGGYPGDMERIAERCRALGIVLIEDAARSAAPPRRSVEWRGAEARRGVPVGAVR
ncbi:DegT/DnrJ/EryC1/StrS family aminotransferase [Streptomyces sp. NPDC004126]|uniref:DegT/DnrJ/EryC1/StrS family aminotransferase n=1 Tax=Streptomyces sp. NPDC004126 TaxID=3390695 RepID=UPI003D03C6BC